MADPVTIGLLIGTGTLAQVGGNLIGNSAKADAEAKNAAFYNEQADFAQDAGFRKEKIFKQQSDELYGTQVSSFSKAGVDISGSALLALEDTRKKQADQIEAIKMETAQNVLEARLKGSNAQGNADLYGSFGYNALSAAGPILTGAGQAVSAFKK